LFANPAGQPIRQLLGFELAIELNRALLSSKQVFGAQYFGGLVFKFGADG